MSTYAKGKAFEQVVAAMIRHKLDATATRDTRSGSNWHRKSDIHTTLPLHIEAKDHATLKPKEWYRQASAGASFGKAPTVVFKSDEDAMAMLKFDDLLDFLVEIADLRAQLADMRRPKIILAKTAEDTKRQLESSAAKYGAQCREGHRADGYGYCLTKNCKYSRGYKPPKANGGKGVTKRGSAQKDDE